MKPFSQLTRNETIDLTNEELNDAIRLEAIERGIKPPGHALGSTQPQRVARVHKTSRVHQGVHAQDWIPQL